MTNRLIQETSPYLLQHAHNPVDWYAWGEEAFSRAKLEDKPILVSIGYAACHWCHVMEKESFEDRNIAAFMNENFINIKIDREERPDLDQIYMDAVQALSGNGGWPLNVFLTPDKKPFYGGTYFPPQDNYNRPSWKRVLESISQAYAERKEEITQQAKELTEYIAKAGNFKIPKEKALLTKESVDTIIQNILNQWDKIWGGYSNAPKFPQTFTILTLLRNYHVTNNEEALRSALLSLDKMTMGGIYDHVGGGFARYSTDKQWHVPHFEKMLYDNALLISALSEAFMITGDVQYKKVIDKTIAFLKRELMHESRAFYTALDADSEGVEGKFYTWSKKEIEGILHTDADLFCELYDVKDEGNWEHTNILWLPQTIEDIAQEQNLPVEEIEKLSERCMQKLMQARAQRVRPALDDKIILSQNALMITALCNAYAATGTETYKTDALTALQFLENNFRGEELLLKHTWKNNEAKFPAFLDDLSYLIKAYIDLHTITGDNKFIIKAKELTGHVVRHYSDEENLMFYFTADFQEDVIVRKKEIHDGATPSGNAVMAHNLLTLSVCFDNQEWRERSENMLHTIAAAVIQHPVSFGVWAMLLQKFVMGLHEIVITGKDAETIATAVLQQYIPNKILFSSNEFLEDISLLKDKYTTDVSYIFVCKDYACQRPVKTVKEMMEVVR